MLGSYFCKFPTCILMLGKNTVGFAGAVTLVVWELM